MATEKETLSTAAAIQQKQRLEPLHVRIAKLREEARADTPRVPPHEELGPEDAAIRMAAGPAASKRDAERRGVFRDLRPGVSVTAEGTSDDTKTVTTKPSPRFATMDDDELQGVNYNTLSSADLRAYTDELDRRTPERPASSVDDPDDLDLDDDDSIQPGFEPLPWEDHHPDNNGGSNNGS
jgi:hypothetical protein